MSASTEQNLSGVAETLLIPLYNRAMEFQRPDAMMKDDRAVELVNRKDLDFSRVRKVPMSEVNRVMRLMLTREMDRYTRNFLSRYPEAAVVHIGCGLDSRYERVDNSRVEWFDLDLPEVIMLRRRYLGGDKPRCHLIESSVLDYAWMYTVKKHAQRPFLFLAETVFVYFSEEQVKSLTLTLREHFTGSELIFDAFSPFDIWIGNWQLSLGSRKYSRLFQWGLHNGEEIENWGTDIRLMDSWGYFDRSEPRLDSIWWIPLARLLMRGMRVYHFQLGKDQG